MIKLGRQINDSMPSNVFKRAVSILSKLNCTDISEIDNSVTDGTKTDRTKKVAILCILKPNIDDTRESIELIKLFEKEGNIR